MLQEPDSMDGLAYFTRQSMKSGNAVVWVKKALCPKCKAPMGKPVVKGKIKVRAKEYECPQCHYSEPQEEHTEKLKAEIKYECPSCHNNGEAIIPFKRKKVRIFSEGTGKETMIDALQFECGKCREKINIAKKMKG